jgi:hypothetical protein
VELRPCGHRVYRCQRCVGRSSTQAYRQGKRPGTGIGYMVGTCRF